MSVLLPGNTTVGDLCTAALQECGRLGIGQTALADDTTKAWARLQWMLQEWEVKRWMIYHLVTYSLVATGQQSYSFGPSGEINTNSAPAWNLESLQLLPGSAGFAVNDTINLNSPPPAGAGTTAGVLKVTAVSGGVITGFSIQTAGPYTGPLPSSFVQAGTSGSGTGASFGTPVWSATGRVVTGTGSKRPAKIESAFLRQIQNSEPNQVDYPMTILQSMEDYNRIALKSLKSFPGAVFLDSNWPLGQLYCYPVPQASIYSINISVVEQLPSSFPTLASAVNLPYEYYSAILYNLALRLRPVYQIGTYPGDPLPGLAKNGMNTVRGPNTQIARLQMPAQLTRPGIYNVFSDQNY